MDKFNVDDLISNVGGDLQNLIAGTPYQTAPADGLQGVNLAFEGEPVPPGVQAGSNVPVQQAPAQQPSVTPSYPVQPQPDPRLQQAEAAVEHFKNLAFEAQRGKIEADEARFEQSLSGLSEEDAQVERIKRELMQQRALNEYQGNRLGELQTAGMQQKQQYDARRQEVAKNQWGFVIATQYNLPYSEPWIQAAIMNSKNPQHMAEIAQGIANSLGQQHAANVQNQLNSGVFAGGGNTGAAAHQPQPKERSGDIGPLIASRGYITVAQR